MYNEQFLNENLQKYFHHATFRAGQREIIKDILEGNNVLGILPTGSGKSICYQLPAVLLEGLTIVVSPLISLMIDQVKELKAKNIKQVAALNSFIPYEDRQHILQHLEQYKLLYISPELLQQDILLKRLSKQKLSLFVIDEAHCISQWGPEFRPDYLKLAEIITYFHNPPTLALSATATPEVQADIIEKLKRENMKRHIYPMDRNNLTFIVEETTSQIEKIDQIITYLEKNIGPALIYFSSRALTEEISSLLKKHVPALKIGFYHGGMDPFDRVTIQQQFMNDQLDIICCTSAFGMGINKQNIRVVIHYHMPAQMEAYIQEVGRAGRDGEPSICLLLYNKNDVAIPRNMIQNELPTEKELAVVMQQLKQLYIQKVELKFDLPEILELLQINETKWRFLRFHFEKHDMIVDSKIVYDAQKWKTVFEALIHWINKRILHKNSELEVMITWATSEYCLRETLYRKFQSGFELPLFQCCSNCGVDLSEWKSDNVRNKGMIEDVDWGKKLRKLLIGERYETK